ncbi:MAG: hypothetical protein B6D41_03895 [Chloroflexi bacterium UTCFX4]|nr:MAG: hypothetical protein B6D41_03895 [Chloroflexi bacterium UTCFX4]
MRQSKTGAYRPKPEFIQTALTPWTRLLAQEATIWNDARRTAQTGIKILIGSSVGGAYGGAPMDTLLAVALTLRGANVHFLLCDRQLPACSETYVAAESLQYKFAQEGPSQLKCDKCVGHGYANLEALDLPIHLFSALITRADRVQAEQLAKSLPLAEIPRYHYQGMSLGEHALANALRFYVKGDLADEPLGEMILRRYLEAAYLTGVSVKRFLQVQPFERAAIYDGIYVPNGIVSEALLANNIPLVRWVPGYRTHTFIAAHRAPPHTELMHEPISLWENLELTPALQEQLMSYLNHRWSAQYNWFGPSIQKESQNDVRQISEQLGIDFRRPTIGLLTNLTWDAQVFYPSNAFLSVVDWVLQTLDYFDKRPDLQLVIRVHPMEVRGTLPTRQPILRELYKARPRLPKNVFVIPPESAINTYVTMRQCNAALIYGTRTGIEVACMGIPVITAGEAWVRNKGITNDAHSAAEYFSMLDQLPLPSRMSDAQILRARKYAYHYYFRRMIPIPFAEPLYGYPPYKIETRSLRELMPGQAPGLDLICDGILNGTAFVYPAERAIESAPIENNNEPLRAVLKQ